LIGLHQTLPAAQPIVDTPWHSMIKESTQIPNSIDEFGSNLQYVQLKNMQDIDVLINYLSKRFPLQKYDKRNSFSSTLLFNRHLIISSSGFIQFCKHSAKKSKNLRSFMTQS
jgi:hypothetical protein